MTDILDILENLAIKLDISVLDLKKMLIESICDVLNANGAYIKKRKEVFLVRFNDYNSIETKSFKVTRKIYKLIKERFESLIEKRVLQERLNLNNLFEAKAIG